MQVTRQEVIERVLDGLVGWKITPGNTPRIARAIDEALAYLEVCVCPVGFGQVADPKCPAHGRRDPDHTITGANL